MNAEGALAFVRNHGVVLVSARGRVPRLTEAIAGKPVKGSWWAHPMSRQIYSILQVVTDSPDVLVCRLVDGKVTLVHRRLWPAVVRCAHRFSPRQIARVREEHTPSGRHETSEVPYPEWVSAEVKEAARRITEEDALRSLGMAGTA